VNRRRSAGRHDVFDVAPFHASPQSCLIHTSVAPPNAKRHTRNIAEEVALLLRHFSSSSSFFLCHPRLSFSTRSAKTRVFIVVL